MLRITREPPAAGVVTLKVEGRLVGPWTLELDRVTRHVLRSGQPVALDLADVTFVDRGGTEVLRALCAGGASLGAASSFVLAVLTRAEGD